METYLSPESDGYSHLPNLSNANTSNANTVASNSAPSTPRPRQAPLTRTQGRASPMISRKPHIAVLTPRANSKEAKRRQDLAIRVITQPSKTLMAEETAQITKAWTSQMRQPYQHDDGPLRAPLPESWTDLLMRLYEAVIQAKNCEIPVDRFWSQYDCSPASFASIPYTRKGIEHTLATIGVECSTQSQGKQVTTGRWLLLRHGHFLLRSQHTITWVESSQPQSDKSRPADLEFAPVVWDWRSGAEKWRWHTWQESLFMRYTPEGEFQVVRDEEQDIML